jgi:hypothetical protein
MDREWFTLRLLQLDIAVLVVIVLVGITVITSRLARDPSESVARWWQDRGRTAAPIDQQPTGSLVQQATTASAATLEQAQGSHLHTPEWLERLIGRHPQGEPGTASGPQAQQPVETGRRVA